MCAQSVRTRDAALAAISVEPARDLALHFIPDDDAAHELVARLLEPLPSGSVVDDHHRRYTATFWANGIPLVARSKDEVERFFTGLDLVAPGVILAHR